jgi:hypothetical protein
MLLAVTGSLLQRLPDGKIDVVVDIPSSVMVVLALAATLIAAGFAMKFARTVGGEMGAGFRFVNIGVAIFAITRVDDLLKVSGTWAKMGIDYKRTLWAPHSFVVFVAWTLIAYGFYRMAKAFTA